MRRRVAAGAPRGRSTGDFISGPHGRLRARSSPICARRRWDAIERQSGLSRGADSRRRPRSTWQRRARIIVLRHGHHPASARQRRRCSRSPTCAAARQYRHAPAPASARCAAIPTCRATAPSASPRSRREEFLEQLEKRVRLQAAARARARRRRGARSDAARRGQGVRRRSAATSPRRCPDSAADATRRCASSTSRCRSSTKLNRSHLVHGREALILPCLGRTEIDVQASGPQSVTVEDSMSMVHASRGTEHAGERASAQRARDRRRPRARHPGDRVKVDWEELGRRLRSHPRRDRGGVPDLPGLQRPHPRARRLPPDLDRPRADLDDAVGHRPTSWCSRGWTEDPHRARSGSAVAHDSCAATINTTPRSIRCRTAIAACSASATCVFINARELAKRGPQGRRPRRPRHGLDRRPRARRAQFPGRRIQAPGRLLRRILSGNQPAGAALCPRRRAATRRHRKRCRSVSLLPSRPRRQLLRDRPITRPALAGRGKSRCACHTVSSRSATGTGQAAERRVA